jgi:hypothetical protein
LKRVKWLGNDGNMELSDSPKLRLVLIWEEEEEVEAAFWRVGMRLLTRLVRLPLLLLRSPGSTSTPSTHVRRLCGRGGGETCRELVADVTHLRRWPTSLEDAADASAGMELVLELLELRVQLSMRLEAALLGRACGFVALMGESGDAMVADGEAGQLAMPSRCMPRPVACRRAT